MKEVDGEGSVWAETSQSLHNNGQTSVCEITAPVSGGT